MQQLIENAVALIRDQGLPYITHRSLKQSLQDALMKASETMPQVPVLCGFKDFSTTDEFDAFYAKHSPGKPRVAGWRTAEEEAADKLYRESAARIMPDFGRHKASEFPWVFDVLRACIDPRMTAMVSVCEDIDKLTFEIEKDAQNRGELQEFLESMIECFRTGRLDDDETVLRFKGDDEHLVYDSLLLLDVGRPSFDLGMDAVKTLFEDLFFQSSKNVRYAARCVTQAEGLELLFEMERENAERMTADGVTAERQLKIAELLSDACWEGVPAGVKTALIKEYSWRTALLKEGSWPKEPREFTEEELNTPLNTHLSLLGPDADPTSSLECHAMSSSLAELGVVDIVRTARLLRDHGRETVMALFSPLTDEARMKAYTLMGLLFAGKNLSIRMTPALVDYTIDTIGKGALWECPKMHEGLAVTRKTKTKRWSSDSESGK